ncbi:MAG: helix-turn-helix domain-containing protein [Panacibacter sp.]
MIIGFFYLYLMAVQHIEFFNIDHFEDNYFRVKPPAELAAFIDFFWQTKFDELLQKNASGFSDVLLPNIGYTYIINLGTPFIMQVADKKFAMKGDGFLPRHKAIECYHSSGNCMFGIKLKISPVLFLKKINFGEYKDFMYPLSYLMEQSMIDRVKKASSFDERVNMLCNYFKDIIKTYSGSWEPVRIVSEILEHCDTHNDFNSPVEKFAEKYNISMRTLHRYFETTTSFSTKKALQIMRIRKATNHLATNAAGFHYSLYGYYDHSHFYKHLKQFFEKKTLKKLQPHLKLLSGLHQQNNANAASAIL